MWGDGPDDAQVPLRWCRTHEVYTAEPNCWMPGCDTPLRPAGADGLIVVAADSAA